MSYLHKTVTSGWWKQTEWFWNNESGKRLNESVGDAEDCGGFALCPRSWTVSHSRVHGVSVCNRGLLWEHEGQRNRNTGHSSPHQSDTAKGATDETMCWTGCVAHSTPELLRRRFFSKQMLYAFSPASCSLESHRCGKLIRDVKAWLMADYDRFKKDSQKCELKLI